MIIGQKIIAVGRIEGVRQKEKNKEREHADLKYSWSISWTICCAEGFSLFSQ